MRRRVPWRKDTTEEPGAPVQLDFDQLLKGGSDEPLRNQGEEPHGAVPPAGVPGDRGQRGVLHRDRGRSATPSLFDLLENLEAGAGREGSRIENDGRGAGTRVDLSEPVRGNRGADGPELGDGVQYAGPAGSLGGVRFRPSGQHDLAPAGALAKTQTNLAALRTLRQLQSENRAATGAEQVTLARWASWGAVPEIFDEANPRFASLRDELRALLSEREWAAARRTTINAHYTSAEVVQGVWSAVTDLGFGGGRVLEPGCGSGNFIGFAPPGCTVTGVE